MVKSGIVISIDRFAKTGVIEDQQRREYFFTIHECFENELPSLYSNVTFIRDPDYKTTLVAALVRRSEVFKKVSGE